MLTATVAHNSEVNLQRNFFGIISVKGFANVIKPYTAKKLIRKPTSKRYIGLNSRITQPAKDRLEIPIASIHQRSCAQRYQRHNSCSYCRRRKIAQRAKRYQYCRDANKNRPSVSYLEFFKRPKYRRRDYSYVKTGYRKYVRRACSLKIRLYPVFESRLVAKRHSI